MQKKDVKDIDTTNRNVSGFIPHPDTQDRNA